MYGARTRHRRLRGIYPSLPESFTPCMMSVLMCGGLGLGKQSALQANPDDPELAARIGRALVAAHDYERAIQYYVEVLQTAPTAALQTDLARLCMRLKRYAASASKVL